MKTRTSLRIYGLSFVCIVILNFIKELYQLKISKMFTSSGEKRIGPEVINHFSCSNQPSMKFILLLNLKLLTIANSFLLNIAEHKKFSASKCENANYCEHFHIY